MKHNYYGCHTLNSFRNGWIRFPIWQIGCYMACLGSRQSQLLTIVTECWQTGFTGLTKLKLTTENELQETQVTQTHTLQHKHKP